MSEHDWLVERFEGHRSRLRAVAYRILGSANEADDALQEAWLRLSRSDADAIENLGGWLTTVVARVCLDMLRSARSRREDPRGLVVTATELDELGWTGPEHEAVLADSVGLALLVVLDALTPAERLAFVLHDMFGLPFDEIGPIVERSPVAAKKLASRARKRIQGTSTVPDADLVRQRRVAEAFLAAARGGDIQGLVAVLHPDVLRRADRAAFPPGRLTQIRGARTVADEISVFARRVRFAELALVNGAVGAIVAPHGRLRLAFAMTFDHDRISEIDVIADPERLHLLELAVLPAGRDTRS